VKIGVRAGASATFKVGATGGPPLSYQWFFNGSVLPGATATNLNLLNVQSTNAGNYWVVITNTSGAITSLAGLHLAFPRYDRNQVDGIWMTRGECEIAAGRPAENDSTAAGAAAMKITAPRAAPPETPRMYGSARGFRNTAW